MHQNDIHYITLYTYVLDVIELNASFHEFFSGVHVCVSGADAE